MENSERVVDLLKKLSGFEITENECNLKEDLLLDSLSMVTLLVAIEDEFNILLDESDMDPYDLNTVSDVINLVDKYRGEDNEEIS